jgi:hypothetical protein
LAGCRVGTASKREEDYRVAGIPRPALLLNGVRVVFWLTVIVILATAAAPAPRMPHLLPWDKAEHFAAFFVLTALAAAASARVSLVLIALWLSLFGCAIELAQALPIIHRDCEIGDWLADAATIAAALTPMMLDRWRRLSLDTQP